MKQNEVYLKIQAAADLLGIHKETLKYWERTGKITVERSAIDGDRIYKLSDLQVLLDKRKKNNILETYGPKVSETQLK